MGCIRPATPGFLATLAATGLLAAVSFGVPLIKSIYFLKATVNGFDGSLTFGTLGYCLDNAGKITCSKPSVGYQLDINTLLGNNTKIQIPNVVVKWITYCLVLHIVALVLAAGSAVFGLLAHIREISITCCSTCISGFGAAVAMIAFIFDLALFFLTKARIKSAGGSASIGNAIWLTLAAWALLFFSGIFFCCGRCCLDSRPSRNGKRSGTGDFEPGHNEYVDQVRMDAIKAEAERQAKQKYGKEGGLPAFQEFQPLTHKESDEGYAYEEGNQVVKQPSHSQLPQQGYLDASSPSQQPATGHTYVGGYMPGQPGGRAVDDYYNPTGAGYPPGPKRQGTIHSQTASTYSQSTYSSPPPPTPAPPLPQANSQYLAVGGAQYGHQPHGTSCEYSLWLPSIPQS
ncbi:pali-domain-containing protein [Thelephora ganbajun]|uniref:Pali-domain-containing protein n=1 Tax=Thelephora ganbajun TaxID=370292 RepID=A0ACB6ZKF8_THEGA|nr:pali-domain-containing protein [Thelephora ganbajun]